MKERIQNSWIYKNNWIFLLIIIGIIGIIGYSESISIKNNGLYTIGYIDRVEGARGGLQVFYHFYYKENIYKSKFTGPFEREEMEGKRFFVQFLAENPKKRRVYTDKPVPSCIEKVPFDGWETIPTKCDE